jgi:hypothetical protein
VAGARTFGNDGGSGKATTLVAPIVASGSAQFYWCREQDLNLHAFWALDPKFIPDFSRTR